MEVIFAIEQKVCGNILIVRFSDGSVKIYDALSIGCLWMQMSNDEFFRKYGFNFNPHNHFGLYEKCRRIVHGE